MRETLADLKARSAHTKPSDPVFVTRGRMGPGRRQTPSNVGRRLKAAIRAANLRLAELDIEPISEQVSPHSLRRTFASVRFAVGDDLVYVAEQLGHEDGLFSARVYAKAVKRRSRLSGPALEEFDRALEWARSGVAAPAPADIGANPAIAGRSDCALTYRVPAPRHPLAHSRRQE